ncbi:MAG: alpha-amylase family glycosyl hydrolase [Luteolibacter sp.]
MKPILLRCLFALLLLVRPVFGETMLQYFNTSWAEITRKMPELAEGGYDALWLPPPTKGSGGLSVGYDVWDRFDLGSKDQGGSVRTRYGSEAELMELVRVAHRFGIRIYFDNIMNHNAFDVPGYNASTPIDVYPGFVPEDFHLRKTEDGFYRKWDNTRDWNDAWQVQNLGLADLIDISTEPGTTNFNHGSYEGDTIPKIDFVRQPSNPEYYCYIPDAPGQKHSAGQGTYVGFGPGNGITASFISANASFYSERVEDFLHRSARWELDRTRADGFRLDAVKHTPADFFGATYGADKNSSNYGYTGQIQSQFNLTRGFSDWDNHRNSVFNTEIPRDDAMLFGEHLGQPPAYGSYIDAGMRLVDNDLRSNLNNLLGNPSSGLNGYDQPGYGGFSAATSVMHAQSHDNDYASRRELQHAFYFTREGMGLVYTDGNYHAETLGESGGAFPRHANTAFLGQWGDERIPNLARFHQNFIRGYQKGAKGDDADFVAYERIDKRVNGSMSDADGATALIMVNDNYANGQGRDFTTSFPPGSLLYQYARGSAANGGSMNGFYLTLGDGGSGRGSITGNLANANGTIVPSGGYYLFSWKNPDPSNVWSAAGGAPVTIQQNGQNVGTVKVARRDGPDGDPNFNPNYLPDTDSADYSYQIDVPRVTDGTNLKFIARADGSTENILLKLDGGIDLNGTGTDAAKRDNPPDVSNEVFLGYEQPTFVQRQGAEKFAATNTVRCKIGSAGSETWQVVSGNITRNDGNGTNPTPANSISFVYHDPAAVLPAAVGTGNQYQIAGGKAVIYVKTPSGISGYTGALYYTTNGTTYPEGAGGEGSSTVTLSVPFTFVTDADGGSWWKAEINPTPSGTLRYKASIYRNNDGAFPLSSVFPSNVSNKDLKFDMMTVFKVENFNATTIQYFPQNDYARTPVPGTAYNTWPLAKETGLSEGFHILRARAFLKRDSRAPIYNTFIQTFYYDAATPGGQIVYPGSNGESVGGSEYGVVVRADNSTTEMWYRIDDGDASNDDTATGATNGNGVWVKGTETTPSASVVPSNPAYNREYRFNYVNIPSSGTAAIQVRFKEISSSADNSLSDAAGHFTTLTRTVTTAGPDLRLFVAYPAADGDVISDNYVLKGYFSKALADGLTEAQLKARFVVRYGANEGWPAAAQSLAPEAVSIIYNETANYHAIAFTLPNLYNGVSDFLHRVEITHDRPTPLVDLVATRRVRAAPSTKPRVTILQPQEFDSNGKQVEIILPDGPGNDVLAYTVRVETDTLTSAVALTFSLGSGTLTPVDADPNTAGIQPVIQGSSAFWDFTWTINAPGTFRLLATATSPGGVNTDQRNAYVIRRQIVGDDPNDLDDDDDGLADFDEGTITPLPNGFPTDDPRYKANTETWTNGDVHVAAAYGHSNPLLPDSDNDGLPDGLEVGWRTPGPDTSITTDTNGDGQPNFVGDLDPPFYNTLDNLGKVPGVNTASEGGDRAKQLRGSMTDPSNPDSDGDGILDGVEDANHNGWLDGDGAGLATNADPTLARNWPNGIHESDETWTETSPTNPDTDGDGLSDGYGEDKNFDGKINGDTNGDRVWQSGESWTETNPLVADTDGDGLPDGWEVKFGLNPLDNGSLALDGTTANPINGASGDPDGDDLTNLQEYVAGTDPRTNNAVVLVPGEEILIGPVADADAVVKGAVKNRKEFTDWKITDLVVLDEFEGDGSGNQGGDTYLANDGFDSSRDMVAFYARDGGDPSVGGTGEFYFRVDFQDLKPYAEEGNLDIYVVIDSGNPAVGEYALPDDVDTGTTMRWEAVVAVRQSNKGEVYVADSNPANNTTAINQALVGVERRDQTAANGFRKAYFDSKLDACEFSISRQALRDAGWLGDPSTLHFQVFTTKDGTKNSPQGAGDIGGRSDIRDTIYDDWLAEDYWRDQAYISANSELKTWFGYNGPDRGKRAKVMVLTHGNEQILAGSEMQDRINDGAGGGYYRMLDAHEAYAAKVGLHVTPTLASAMQWASADPPANKPWRDGPAFNQRIGRLAAEDTVEMIASTFADSPMSYFSQSFLADNVALSNRTLSAIYGTAPSSRAFWIPERIMDEGVMGKVSALGYSHVFADQFRHILDRFGRSSTLQDDGYRINRINGLNTIVINDQASTFRFRNTDSGLDSNLRQLLSRKSRSGEQHQLLVLYSDWSDFRTKANADAYDNNIAWLASRPWVELVGPDQVARGAVDLSLPPDGNGDQFASLERGNTSFGRKLGPLWVDHSTEGNYDNWYFGTSIEESLRDKVFEIRPGIPIDRAGDDFFGVQSFNNAGAGIAADAWSNVSSLPDTALGRLGRGTYHASTFLAGWHAEDNSDLRTYSTGAFIYPDTSLDQLAGFSKQAQSQARFASIYQAVASWAASPPATAEAVSLDVDLDGESEYILRNGKVFALFESLGGRCTAAWSRDPATGRTLQVIGNHLSASGTENEQEGASNRNVDGSILARRTSAFKDWWAIGGSGGTSQFVNSLYTVTSAPAGTGWTFTAPGGGVTKTITLGNTADKLVGAYSLAAGYTKLFVRFGLSPDLDDLLVRGQQGLATLAAAGGVTVSNTTGYGLVSAKVGLDAGVTWQSSATDDDLSTYDTLVMRNQAQVQQIEVESQSTSFTVSLSLTTQVTDGDSDGLPADWETAHGLNDTDATGDNGASGDPDHDGITNIVEWLVGLNPQVVDNSSYPKLAISKISGGVHLSFPTLAGRKYQLQESTTLGAWNAFGAPLITAPDALPGTFATDDIATLPKRFYRMLITPAP